MHAQLLSLLRARVETLAGLVLRSEGFLTACVAGFSSQRALVRFGMALSQDMRFIGLVSGGS